MRRTLCALAIAIAGIGVAAPPAQADSPRCVSKGEYRQVHRGMSRGQVHRVFDTRGHRRAFARVGRFRSEVRVYRGCGRRSAVSVAYSRGRVRAKSAIFR